MTSIYHSGLPHLLRIPGLAAVLMLCLMTRCLAQAAASESNQSRSGSISGKVTVSGKAAANIKLVLIAKDSSHAGYSLDEGPVARTRTDEAGSYVFNDLGPGRYEVSPVTPAYVVEGLSSSEEGKYVLLDGGEQATGIDLNLSPGGVITGRVIDAANQPMIDMYVSLEKLDEKGKVSDSWSSRRSGAGTDDRGIYRAYGLAAGRYKVSAGGLGSIDEPVHLAKTYAPGVTDPSRATVVEVTPGSESSNIDISFGAASKTHSASGRFVEAETGRPIPYIQFQYNSNGAFFSEGSADANGQFDMQGLGPGHCQISDSQDDSTGYVVEPTGFDITDSDVTGVEVKVHAGATISGTVTLEANADPSAAAQVLNANILAVSVSQSNGGTLKRFRQSPDGSFRITGIAAGTVSFLIGPFGSGATVFRIVHVEHEGAALPDGIEVGPGQEVSGVKIVLTYGTGSIRGSLVVTGPPVPRGARLFVTARNVTDGPNARPMTGSVDAVGNFRIDSLSDGDYELAVQGFELGHVLAFKSDHPPVSVVNGQTLTTTIQAEYQPLPENH